MPTRQPQYGRLGIVQLRNQELGLPLEYIQHVGIVCFP